MAPAAPPCLDAMATVKLTMTSTNHSHTNHSKGFFLPMFTLTYVNAIHLFRDNTFLNFNLNLFIIMDDANKCYTALVNVIKFKINYSCFFKRYEEN